MSSLQYVFGPKYMIPGIVPPGCDGVGHWQQKVQNLVPPSCMSSGSKEITKDRYRTVASDPLASVPLQEDAYSSSCFPSVCSAV